MKTVTFQEYEDAKLEIIRGVEWHEDTTFPNQYGMMSKTYCTKDNGTFYEVTDPNTGITEFWSTKYSQSRYYDGRTREEIIAQYEEKLNTSWSKIQALEIDLLNKRKECDELRGSMNQNASMVIQLRMKVKELVEKIAAIHDMAAA